MLVQTRIRYKGLVNLPIKLDILRPEGLLMLLKCSNQKKTSSAKSHIVFVSSYY